jgi:ketosteroid isomerase-like protein
VDAAEVKDAYLAAARAGDFEAAYQLYAEDVVGHVPGRSSRAGELRGRAAVREYIEAARAVSQGHDVELEVVDVLSSQDRFAFVLVERFHLGDRTVDIRRANVYRVDGGRIAEVSIYEGDQYAVDELLP